MKDKKVNHPQLVEHLFVFFLDSIMNLINHFLNFDQSIIDLMNWN